MKGKFAALAALVVLCVACGVNSPWFKTTDQYWKGVHEKYIAEHPGLRPEVAQAIRDSEVIMGMTELEVAASIGRPYDINRTTMAYGTSAQFVYTGTSLYSMKPKYSYVYFENGKVTSWQQ